MPAPAIGTATQFRMHSPPAQWVFRWILAADGSKKSGKAIDKTEFGMTDRAGRDRQGRDSRTPPMQNYHGNDTVCLDGGFTSDAESGDHSRHADDQVIIPGTLTMGDHSRHADDGGSFPARWMGDHSRHADDGGSFPHTDDGGSFPDS